MIKFFSFAASLLISCLGFAMDPHQDIILIWRKLPQEVKELILQSVEGNSSTKANLRLVCREFSKIDPFKGCLFARDYYGKFKDLKAEKMIEIIEEDKLNLKAFEIEALIKYYRLVVGQFFYVDHQLKNRSEVPQLNHFLARFSPKESDLLRKKFVFFIVALRSLDLDPGSVKNDRIIMRLQAERRDIANAEGLVGKSRRRTVGTCLLASLEGAFFKIGHELTEACHDLEPRDLRSLLQYIEKTPGIEALDSTEASNLALRQ